MRDKILIANYLFIDEHHCAISRIELLKSLSKINYKTYLYFQTLTAKNLFVDEIDEIFIKRISSNRYIKYLSYILLSMFFIPSIIIKRKINFIIIDPYTIIPMIPFIILTKLFKKEIKIIVDFRSGIFHLRESGLKNIIRDKFLKIIIKISTRIIGYYTFVSDELKFHIERTYNLENMNRLVWSSAVNEKFINYPLENINQKNEKIKLVYHGSLGPDRGILELCKACKGITNVHLFIIGSGLLTKELNDYIKNNNISNITTKESMPQNQIIDEISQMDFGVVPLSDTLPMRTSSPLKLIEYLSLNKPVIATGLQSFKNTFKNVDSILFITDNSPKQIQEGIMQLISELPTYKKLAIHGRTFIKENYTWEIQASRLDEFIRHQ